MKDFNIFLLNSFLAVLKQGFLSLRLARNSHIDEDASSTFQVLGMQGCATLSA